MNSNTSGQEKEEILKFYAPEFDPKDIIEDLRECGFEIVHNKKDFTFTQEEVAELFKLLYMNIAHGDEGHRKWLKEKIQHFYSTEVEKHTIKTIPNDRT
jgi:hypothetical protein